MVRRLVLWCTYTGAPRLVTWGARERGWNHFFLQCSSGTPSPSPLPLEPRPPPLPHVCLGSNPPAQGVSIPSCPSPPPGCRKLGTWTKLLSNMGSGRRGRYSPFWRVFCSSPRVGTHFAGPWSGSMRLMFRNRFMAAGEKVGHHGHTVREPGAWAHGLRSVPQPTRPGPSGFTGAGAQRFRGWSFPRAWPWPCRGRVVSPGLGRSLPVEGLCDLIRHV